MDLNIYYDIRNHGKYETLRTNDKTIKKYIDDAQNYYKLKEKFDVLVDQASRVRSRLGLCADFAGQ